MIHFWARRKHLAARPSNPSASQPGCAARALAHSSATCSAFIAGTSAMISPVAGFSTSIFAAAGAGDGASFTTATALSSPAVVEA